MSQVIQTTIRQVEAQGVSLRGLTLVKVDENTVKFAKRGRSVTVAYVPGLDLYTVRVHRYHPTTLQVLEDREVEMVYAESLPNFFNLRRAS